MFIFSQFHTNVEIEIDLLNYRVREGKMSREIRLFTKSWGIVDVFTDNLFIARNKLQLYILKRQQSFLLYPIFGKGGCKRNV